jgi:DNA-binding Lrp family transcriptional regulator
MSIHSIFVEESFNNKEAIKRVEAKLIEVSNKINITNEKLDTILNLLTVDVKEKCDKMGEHIDFIENVYDSVKNPLGYLCNKLNSFTDNSEYTLEDFKDDDEVDSETESVEEYTTSEEENDPDTGEIAYV